MNTNIGLAYAGTPMKQKYLALSFPFNEIRGPGLCLVVRPWVFEFLDERFDHLLPWFGHNQFIDCFQIWFWVEAAGDLKFFCL